MGIWWVRMYDHQFRAVIIARGVVQARRFMETHYGWTHASYTYVGQSVLPGVLVGEPVVLSIETGQS